MTIYSAHASGLGNSAAYQVAGKPYLTGSVIDAEGVAKPLPTRDIYTITFPTVTRRVMIKNHSATTDLAVFFANPSTAPAAATGIHFNIISANTGSFDAGIKCKELFLVAGKEGAMTNSSDTSTYAAGAFTVFAELTGVPASDMYELSGSGINASTYSNGQV